MFDLNSKVIISLYYVALKHCLPEYFTPSHKIKTNLEYEVDFKFKIECLMLDMEISSFTSLPMQS